MQHADQRMSALENTCRGLIFSSERDCATFRGKQPGKGQEWVQNGVWWVRHKGNIVLHLVSKELHHFDENCDFRWQKKALPYGGNKWEIWENKVNKD